MGHGAGRGSGKDEEEPALPKPGPKPDQITAVIGEVGKWQLLKILLVFIAAAPGLAHIFHASFITPKQKFWCEAALNSEWSTVVKEARDAGFAGLPGLPASDDPKLPDSANLTSGLNSGPWPVHYKSSKNGSYADMWTKPELKAEGYKVLGHCIPGCQSYGFDDEWKSTMITEWDLVCEDKWMKTFAKLLLFSGFALGSFCS
jgi:hypothetical protein